MIRASVVLALFAALAPFGRAEEAEGDEPFYSLVFLLSEPRQIDGAGVAERMGKGLGASIPVHKDEDADGDGCFGEGPTFAVSCQEYVYLVHVFPRPYFEEAEAGVKEIADKRLRESIVKHQGWVAVDVIQTPEGADRKEVYRRIGRALAEFAGDDCLAIYSPETNRIQAYAPEVLDTLRSEDPLAAVESWNLAPVLEISADDPEMKAAVAEARRRWPEFVEAFAKKGPDDHFVIKAPFTDGTNTEFMWVEVTSIEGETIRGKLGNRPFEVQGVKEGDEVSVKLADLNDWMYKRGEAAVGGFTVEVLQKAQEKKR